MKMRRTAEKDELVEVQQNYSSRLQEKLIPFLFEDAPYKTDAKLHTVAAIHELPLRE